MALNLDSYVPTLGLKPAEMRAVEYLPTLSKDRILPCFLFSPWSSSRSIERGMDRIEEAFPNRQFFLDLDRDYDGGDWARPAQREFRDLINSENNYESWWDHWVSYPNAIPCLQLVGADKRSIESQIDNLQAVERSFCLRLRLDRLPHNLAEIIEILDDRGTADYSVILDGGWTSDPLTLSATMTGLINNTLAPLDGRIPVIVSCTSAPRDYSAFEGVVEVPNQNRQLLSNVRQAAQRDTIVFGDWGTTKPREYGFGRTPLPRIDFPLDNGLVISRNRSDDWGFRDAAEALIDSAYWDGNLDVWGEELIEETLRDEDFGVNSPQKNVACRINIHLHRQALFGQNVSGIDLEEDWED